MVQGYVQGVGFRWFVARHAEARHLRGYVRNRGDGAVEIEAEGERESLEEFLGAVRTGPRSARVEDVLLEWVPPHRGESGFHIRD
jgi:acylphosphatase